MEKKVKPFRKTSLIAAVLEREEMGFAKYRKRGERDPEKRRILLDLAMNKIRKADERDFIRLGPRRRLIKFSTER